MLQYKYKYLRRTRESGHIHIIHCAQASGQQYMTLVTYPGLVLGVYIRDEVPLAAAVGAHRGAAREE